MRKLFLTILGILAVQAALAQTDESQKYMRGSLCMMMVEHPTLEYNKDIEQVFEKMDIPERFNSHDLGVRIIRFANDKDQQANITIFAKDNQLGKKFVSKWFGRNKKTGAFNIDLVKERGNYNATKADVENALRQHRGLSILEDAGENLIGHTYWVVNDVKYVNQGNFFKGMKDAEGNEIGLNGRTFPFSLYETDSTYNTAGVNKIETIDSDNNATVNFTTIQYTEEMIYSHSNGDFYYVIKEDGAGTVNNGVKNWDGEIRIKLHAEVQDNNIVFTMRYMRFASKEALDAGITENEVRDIPVAGDNYTFGRVFNTYDAKTDIQLGATKTLDGAAASDPFSFTITEVKDAEGTPLDSGDAFTDTKSNGNDGKVTFEKIEYTAADASSEGRKHY